MRERITPPAINNLVTLRWLLAGLPIPPNLLKLCYYLMQTFNESDCVGTSLIKMTPVGNILLNGNNETSPGYSPDVSAIATAIDGLQTYRSTFAVIARACPAWITGYMPSSNSVAFYDDNFKTIFANLPATVGQDSQTTLNLPNNLSNSWISAGNRALYSSWTDNLDGGAYALMSIFDETSAEWLPSLITPVPTTYRVTNPGSATQFNFSGNQYLYASASEYSLVGSNTGFNQIVHISFTNTTTDPIKNCFTNEANSYDFGISTISPGACPVLGVTPSTIYETSIKLTEWLMSIDSIGVLPDKRDYNKPFPNRGNTNNRRGRR
jgi:hypothetical protein